MDIVTLKGSTASKKRTSARRHTTEVSMDQLPSRQSRPEATTLSSSNDASYLKPEGRGSDYLSHLGDDLPGLRRSPLSSSWNTLFGAGISDFETSSEVSESPYLEGSQSDILNDVMQLSTSALAPSHLLEARHGYQLSYELALDNVLTPIANSQPTSPRLVKPLSHVAHVIQEMVTTERSYVRDLSNIIEGYFVPMETKVGILPLKPQDLINLFGNLAAITEFNGSLLEALQACGNSGRKVGQCFLDKAEGFKIYTQYCTNYPTSVTVLARLSKNMAMSVFLKGCQQRLGHMLPLGAYLLKPVQRVLKYSLLLQDMAKHMRTKDTGYPTVYRALGKMTEVAEHINAMKKKYDAAVHVQEIQSLIRGWEEIDLTKCGDLVLEENFRYYGGRTSGPTFRTRADRYLFLFQRLFLMTKKDEDGFQYKTHLEMKDIQLTERIEKEQNSFQIRQVSTGRFYTFQARNLRVKEQWVRTIKLLLMESIPHLPDKAKLLILAGFPTDLGEATRGSPTRQRHSSEELTHALPGKKAGRWYAKPDGTKPATQDKSRQRGNRKRRSTSPNVRIASPTHSLIKASFTGYLAATVQAHPEKDESPTDEETEEFEHMTGNGHHLIVGHTDSGFSESLAGVTEEDSQRQTRASSLRTLDEAKHPQNAESGVQAVSTRSKDDSEYHPRTLFLQGSAYSSSRSASGSPEPSSLELRMKRSSSFDRIAALPEPVVTIDMESENGESSENSSRESQIDVSPESKGDPEGPREVWQQLEVDTFQTESMSSQSHDEAFDQTQGHRAVSDKPTIAEPLEIAEQPCPPLKITVSETEPAEMPDSDSLIANNVTDEDEQLFSELMESHNSASSSSNHQGVESSDARLLKVYHGYNHVNEGESHSDEDTSSSYRVKPPAGYTLSDQDETPKASPCSIRRWTVQRKAHTPTASEVVESEDINCTPKASPAVLPKYSSTTSELVSSSSSSEDLPSVLQPPTQFKESVSVVVDPLLRTIAADDRESAQKAPQDKHLLKVRSSAIVRRHSYNERFARRFGTTDGSRSTGNSPKGSPKAQTEEGSSSVLTAAELSDLLNKEKTRSRVLLKRRSSIGYEEDRRRRPISMVGLVSTTRNDLSLEDLMSIDAAHLEREGEAPYLKNSALDDQTRDSPEEQDRQLSLVRATDRQRSPRAKEADSTPPLNSARTTDEDFPKSKFRIARHKKAQSPLATASSEATPMKDHDTQHSPVPQNHQRTDSRSDDSTTGTVAPYEGNPEEHVTFDEVLAGFDHYATATGKTTRSKEKYQKASPEPGQPKRKRRRWRRKTVATVDASTMKDVRAYLSEDKDESRHGSKVQQLARQYSKMIKDHQQSKVFKRYSTVVEEPPDTLDHPQRVDEPRWLKVLKEKTKSRSQSSDEDDSPSATPRAIPQMDRTGLFPDSSEKRRPVARTKSFTMPRISSDHGPEASNVSSHTPSRLQEDRRRSSIPSDDEEFVLQRRGRFKGWVKSLVERFSSGRDK